MKLYTIQVGFKGTNGRLQQLEQSFEGETPESAMEMAKAFYSDKIRYRTLSEMIFSTPQEVISGQNRSVSIGGSANGASIITGNSTIVQSGKHNISVGSWQGGHIGDVIIRD